MPFMSSEVGRSDFVAFFPDLEDWQKKIVMAFNEEFGEETEYWVEW